MNWKCACTHINDNEAGRCSNCGRTKPKYLGITLDVASDESLTDAHFGVWYLHLAYTFLLKMEESALMFKKNFGSLDSKVEQELNRLYSKVHNDCNRAFSMLEKAEKHDNQAQIEIDSQVIGINSLRSSCYFELGRLEFSKSEYAKAIEYYQKSFDLDPNQASIYNIAMATINLPAEGGGLFGGKKKQIAEEEKRKQETDLLIKTTKFAPFSKLGIESAAFLLENYRLVMTPEDF